LTLVGQNLMPPSRLAVSRIESGGGDNGVLVEDSDDGGPAARGVKTTWYSVPSPVLPASTERRVQDPARAATWGQPEDAFFAAEGLIETFGPREVVLSDTADVFGALPDPLAAVGVLAIALSGYWSTPAGQETDERRRFDKPFVLR